MDLVDEKIAPALKPATEVVIRGAHQETSYWQGEDNPVIRVTSIGCPIQRLDECSRQNARDNSDENGKSHPAREVNRATEWLLQHCEC
jgi:single-stranded DNA-binding protein